MLVHAAEATLHAILESASQAILVTEDSGDIILANAMAERMFGYSRQELIGSKIEVLVPPRFREHHAKHRDGYFHDPRVRPMGVGLELAAVRKGGSEFPVEISLSFVRAGERTLAVSFVTDITERVRHDQELRRANEALKRSNAALEQFAFAASHDLREPLRMIESYAQLLDRRYVDKLGSSGADFIHHITDGVGRMNRLLAGILEYSRVQSDTGAPRMASTRAALDQALANLSKIIKQSDALILADVLPDVAAIELHVTQIFQNLIANAIKYRSEERPRIQITATREEDWLKICVKDNGIGIAPEHHERIFGLFKRLHGADVEGTGIGLAICKRLVDAYGGTIGVESNKGKGAKVCFTLPALA